MPADYDDLRDEFNDFTGTDEDWAEWSEIYAESGASQEDADDDLYMFRQFLNAFYLDVEPQSKAYWDEIRQSFYDLSGVTEYNIDWELLRELWEQESP